MKAADTQTIAALAPRVARGEITSIRLTEECLATIERLNPSLNAFISVCGDEALAAARDADREIAAGRYRGPLHGIPISLKDLIDQTGLPTTAASRVREAHRATSDAPVTARLREAGAVLVGKTNLHEFAFGTTSDDSGWGSAHNPIDPSRSPGGSSGGSAIAVRTGMSLGSIGTDTGGSIRIPAAACGIVGLKPGWNEVPAEGVVPLSRQLDHVGPLARCVADAWIIYDVLRGEANANSPLRRSLAEGASVIEGRPLNRMRLAMLGGYFLDRLDEDVAATFAIAVERLKRAGVEVIERQIPHAAEIAAVYVHIVLADAAAYHAPALERHPEDYTSNVRLRLEMGRYVLAEDYVRALDGRATLRREVIAALADVDALLLPALSIPAPPIGADMAPVRGGEEPVRNAMLRCTQLFNVTGHPAISIPCGETPAGLPVGLQLVGAHEHTHDLLQVARAAEAVYEFGG
jgi:aspartyl-tRNA(Asn)/glutamyl-tRNA(Gln) amidotransferase subunit A